MSELWYKKDAEYISFLLAAEAAAESPLEKWVAIKYQLPITDDWVVIDFEGDRRVWSIARYKNGEWEFFTSLTYKGDRSRKLASTIHHWVPIGLYGDHDPYDEIFGWIRPEEKVND